MLNGHQLSTRYSLPLVNETISKTLPSGKSCFGGEDGCMCLVDVPAGRWDSHGVNWRECYDRTIPRAGYRELTRETAGSRS